MLPLAAVLVAAQGAGAQSVAKIVAKDIEYAARDFASIWMSPFDASTRDYLIAAGVVGVAAIESPFDDEVDRWAIRNRDRGFLDAIKPFRRGRHTNMTQYIAAIARPTAIGAIANGSMVA